jgi:hypothetical protein
MAKKRATLSRKERKGKKYVTIRNCAACAGLTLSPHLRVSASPCHLFQFRDFRNPAFCASPSVWKYTRFFSPIAS